MNAAMRKTTALLSKDFVDVVKNPTMLICSLLPIAFVFLYSQMSTGDAGPEQQEALRHYFLTMAFCMTAGMVGSMTVLTAIAEEKEKHTLRTLMMANVSAGQILASRSVVAFATIVVVDAVCFFILRAPASELGAFLVISLLGSIPIVMIALLLGLAARDQMTAGLYSFPIVLIAFLPAFSRMNETLAKISPFFPTGGASELLELSSQGGLLTSDAVQPLVVTVVWIVATLAAFALVYRRLARDN